MDDPSFGWPTCLKFILFRKRLFIFLLAEHLLLYLGCNWCYRKIPNEFLARSLKLPWRPGGVCCSTHINHMTTDVCCTSQITTTIFVFWFEQSTFWIVQCLAFSIASLPHSTAFESTRAVHMLHWAFAARRDSAAGICNRKVKAIIYWRMHHKDECNVTRPMCSHSPLFTCISWLNSSQSLPRRLTPAGQ